MKELTFKKKGVVHTPLTFWKVDGTSTIAIYQGGRGARPDLDFIVKHKEEGKRLRTPSHTHWIVDLIAKKQCAPNVIRGFIDEVVTIRDNYMFETEIIVAAVRNARQIVDAAVMGADIVTAGLPVYQAGFDHPYTRDGIQKFINFWDQTQYE